MTVYGVDVHDGYQAGLSFATLYQQGYRFAAVKLTEGSGYVRPKAAAWIRAARAAGLIPGAYHWLTSADGAAQARWFHRHVLAAGGPAGMLIQLDCEDDGYGPQITAWAQQWRALTDSHPFLVYSSGWWWNDPARPMRAVRGVDVTPHLWHARYLGADPDAIPDDPAAFAARIPASWWTPGYGGWPTATIIQFTSKGDAGGLANKVDLNVYRGTLEQLLALTTTTAVTGDQDMTPEQDRRLYNVDRVVSALLGGSDTVTQVRLQDGTLQDFPLRIARQVNAAAVGVEEAKAAALAARAAAEAPRPVSLDAATIATIVAGLTPAIQEAIAGMPAQGLTREDVDSSIRAGIDDTHLAGPGGP